MGGGCVGEAENAFPFEAVLRRHGDCAWSPQMGTEWVQDCETTIIQALFLVLTVKSPIVWNNDTVYLQGGITLHCLPPYTLRADSHVNPEMLVGKALLLYLR